MEAPIPPAIAISASATASPPSDRSCAAVMRRSAIREATNAPLRRSPSRSTGGGAPSSRPATTLSQAERPSQSGRPADEDDVVPLSLEGGRHRLRYVRDEPDAADRRGWRNARAHRLVIERHIARHDREIERSGGLADPVDSADELPHRVRLLRIAEIEIVGQRQRPRADRDEVAPGFGDRLPAALARVRLTIALGAVGRQRQALRPVAEPDHRRAPAGPLDGVAENQRIVLLVDPALGA